MKRRPLLMLLLSVVALSVVGIGMQHRLNKQAQEKREVAYQSALGSYAQVLKPGMTRKAVEDYLRGKNVKFRQMCCVDPKDFSKGSWDDLTKIGEEDVPWVCRENNVNVAFQFTDHEEHEVRWQAHDLDTLKALTIYHQLEGCL